MFPEEVSTLQKKKSAGYNCPAFYDALEAPASKQNVSKRVLEPFQNRFRGFPGVS